MDTPRDVLKSDMKEALVFHQFILRVYNTAKESAKFDHTDFLHWLMPCRVAVTISEYAASIPVDAFDRAFIDHALNINKSPWPSTSPAYFIKDYQFHTRFWWDFKLWHDEAMEAGLKYWGADKLFLVSNVIWNIRLPSQICARRKCFGPFHCTCDDPLLPENNYQSTKPLPPGPPLPSSLPSAPISVIRRRIHV